MVSMYTSDGPDVIFLRSAESDTEVWTYADADF